MKKILKTLVWIIFLIPAAYLSIIWQSLPERVPMHYNLNGEVDRIGSKSELIFLVLVITGVNIGTYLLLVNIHRIDTKKYVQENKDRMFRIGFIVSVFISAILCVLLYNTANEISKLLPGIIFSAVGLLLSFTGNYMYNIKPNYYAGFRMPWTLKNEENWRKTHHLGGKLWFIGGLVIAIVCLFLPFRVAFIFFLSIITIMTIIPLVYSYRLHKQQKTSR
jgi:uncharacterized membrane protein